jgi:predicted ribosome quality control (RQC) complex YloA/Tae2 family protein
MANKFADARRSLIRAKESAKQRLQEIENERREIKASMKSLEAALKALGRENQPQQRGELSPDEANQGTTDATS